MYKTICLLLSTLLALGFLPARAAVLRLEVNLDDPPRQRFRHIAKYWAKTMHYMGPQMEEKIRLRLGEEDFEAWKAAANSTFDKEQEEEMQGILDAAGPGPLTLLQIKLSNMLYELGLPTMCSGVLTARPDGYVIQGRNLDFAFPFQDGSSGTNVVKNWPDVTFDVTFHKGGQPLIAASMWPMNIAFVTGMRFSSGGAGGWSWQQNARGGNAQKQNLAALKQGGVNAALFARRLMESTPDFNSAVEALYKQKFSAPMYFALAGPGQFEGAVLSLDRLARPLSTTPPIVRMTPDNWYLVQTNDDYFNPEGQFSQPAVLNLDPRRIWTTNLLQSKKEQRDTLSVESMFHLMHTYPLMETYTVYTTVMTPATGYYQTILPMEDVPTVGDNLGTCVACMQLDQMKVQQQQQAQAQQEAAELVKVQQHEQHQREQHEVQQNGQQPQQTQLKQEQEQPNAIRNNPTRRQRKLRGTEMLPHPDE